MLKLNNKKTILKINNGKFLLLKNNPYFIINALITGIILLLLVYSGIFSATGFSHPIKSLTTEPTISTGLSRAFSEIVRFNFSEAIQFNPYSISIFLFFFFQLIFRIINIILLLSTNIRKNLLAFVDILTSVLLFLWSFSKFIVDQF